MFKNNKKTMKTIVFSLVLAAMTLTANHLNAQDRGLFGMGKSSADYDYTGNRDGDGGISMGGMQDENPTPLGSGLLIMLGAGIGYVALKKKKED